MEGHVWKPLCPELQVIQAQQEHQVFSESYQLPCWLLSNMWLTATPGQPQYPNLHNAHRYIYLILTIYLNGSMTKRKEDGESIC